MQPSNTPEEWRAIPGWEGIYEVSSHGRVRSVDRQVTHKDGRVRTYPSRILRPATTSHGCKSLVLSHEGSPVTKRIHWLVLEAFVGPRPEGMHACHWDDDPANNHLSNLRWDTPSANRFDSVRNGKHQSARITHCPQGHEYTPDNTAYWAKGNGKKGRACRACDRARQHRRQIERANKGVA